MKPIVDNNKWLFKSPYSVKETIDRMLAAVKQNPDVAIYERIDQQAIAKKNGVEVRPCETVSFQNTKLVGPLLELSIRTAEILPMQIVAYEKEDGQVWLVTNNPQYMNDHYELKDDKGIIDKILTLFPGWVEEALS